MYFLSQRQYPTSLDEKGMHEKYPNALAIGLIMYIMICTRPDVLYAISINNMYQLFLVIVIRSPSRISMDILKSLRMASWSDLEMIIVNELQWYWLSKTEEQYTQIVVWNKLYARMSNL